MGLADSFLSSLLQSNSQEQRSYVEKAIELYRGSGPLALGDLNAIPPPPSHATIVALLPPTEKPPENCLLISLEDYKQQVAQLANMKLAG
ncbi:rna polymerase-associated protein rtf1 [Cystoisospora suis]|uniref:Rna polymerase-associated protein rtf1 n=1 Tax=Cystoisospora suis TaxID=483139 RepID=A0A2C6KHZ4_9APIC|nr:rna polymerase-associated protein rtf1 [Cystoisospora suis]